jgi:hypothetical protein
VTIDEYIDALETLRSTHGGHLELVDAYGELMSIPEYNNDDDEVIVAAETA